LSMDLLCALLLLLAAAGAAALQVLLSYRGMLAGDAAPWWSALVGRQKTVKAFEYLVYRAMAWDSLKEVHLQAMKEKAVETSEALNVQHRADGAAKGGVVFLGGSLLSQVGDLQERVAAHLGRAVPVVNAAYAGTTTTLVHESLEALALRHKPAVLVYACGSHDLFCGSKAAEAAAAIRASHAALRERLPQARVVLVALPVTPLHRALAQEEEVKKLNRLLQEDIVAGDGGKTFLLELDPLSEAPPQDVYLPDDHHFCRAGREMLLAALLPVLKEQLAAAGVCVGKPG